jgi:hypothetical protein
VFNFQVSFQSQPCLFQLSSHIAISLKIMTKANTSKLSVRGNKSEPATRNTQGRFTAKRQAKCPRCGYSSIWDSNLKRHNLTCRKHVGRKPKQPKRKPVNNQHIATFLWHPMKRCSDIKPKGSIALRNEAWQSATVWIFSRNFP